jgi:hypothetical protein
MEVTLKLGFQTEATCLRKQPSENQPLTRNTSVGFATQLSQSHYYHQSPGDQQFYFAVWTSILAVKIPSPQKPFSPTQTMVGHSNYNYRIQMMLVSAGSYFPQVIPSLYACNPQQGSCSRMSARMSFHLFCSLSLTFFLPPGCKMVSPLPA